MRRYVFIGLVVWVVVSVGVSVVVSVIVSVVVSVAVSVVVCVVVSVGVSVVVCVSFRTKESGDLATETSNSRRLTRGAPPTSNGFT